MIARLRGTLVSKKPTRLLLDTSGIAFEISVPLSTSRALPECGDEATVYVVMHVTRSGVELYGFATEEEKQVFELLTSVKGVGPRATLNLLSRFTPDEITTAINQGKTEPFRSTPGIGPKKVEAILRQLRPGPQLRTPAPSGSGCTEGEKPSVPESRQLRTLINDALTALIALGLSRKEAEQRLAKLKIAPEMGLQELLKQTLAQK